MCGTVGGGLYLGLENFVRVLEYLGRSLSNLRGSSEFFKGAVKEDAYLVQTLY